MGERLERSEGNKEKEIKWERLERREGNKEKEINQRGGMEIAITV